MNKIASPDELIRVTDLCRRDATTSRMLLDSVSLSIDVGQQVGLVGPSGSGKSTLLRSIARLDAIDAGQIHCCGREVTGDEVPAYRRRVIYLPQRPAFVDGSVRENLELPLGWSITPRPLDQARLAGYLEKLGKPDGFLDQSAQRLSGGEQLIVSLLRAILLDPEVLLMDEPTAALDADTTLRFEELASAWFDDRLGGAAWIWTSHDAAQVSRMTTRSIQIDGGRIKQVDVGEADL